MRCYHESKLHSENSFITLTYDEENVPQSGSLVKEDFQKFMKNLRWHNREKTIRFFHCGEYGDENNRPHYHACIFGHDFPDKILWKTVNEIPYYTSEKLGRLWDKGWSTIGEVTFESAAYAARYITKKITGPHAQFHYTREDEKTGEIYNIEPEYTTMSRRPGIGHGWYERFKTDCYPHDFVVLRGVKMQPAKYYLNQLQKEHELTAKKVAAKRQLNKAKNVDKFLPERLRDKEFIQYERLSRLTRGYER